MENSSISSDITVKELLARYPQLLQVFMDMGLLCVGCPAEAFHTLREVAHEYHLNVNQFVQSIEMAVRDDNYPPKKYFP